MASRSLFARQFLGIAPWFLASLVVTGELLYGKPLSLFEKVVVGAPAVLLLAFAAVGARAMLVGRFWKRKRRLLTAATLLVGALAVGVVYSLVLSFAASEFSREASRALFLPALLVGAGLVLVRLLVFTADAALRGAEKERRHELSRELRRKELELQVLAAKFRPHFLFNALNSVAALTRIDPAKAREMTVALAELLRETLRSDGHELVPLAEEVESAHRYLSLERIRFGERLALDFPRPTEWAEVLVPRFFLQPLLENVIRHGVEVQTEPCRASVRFAKIDEALECVVENEKGGEPKRPSTSLGLALVRSRIEALSGGRGSVTTDDRPTHFSVRIRWPLSASEGTTPS